MKKVLLLSAAVCMALTMSAQKLPTAQKATLSADKTLVAPTWGYAQKVLANTVQPKQAPAKVAAMPTLASVTGLYICDNTQEGDGTRSYTKSKSFSMEQLDEIVVLEGGTVEDPVNYNCNVLIKDLMVNGTETYAVYDEKEGTLSIPCLQNTLSSNYDYYFVNLMSINDNDEVEMSYAIPVVLEVEEDVNGFYFVNNTEYLGFGLVVFDETGTPIGFGDTCMNDVAFTPCNYICDEEQRNSLSTPDSPWEYADPYGVFIEKITDEEFAIHGFMELGTVSVTIDEEGSGLMETLQPLQYANIGQGEYDYVGAIKWGLDGDYINADAEIPYIECGFYNFTTRDENDKIIAEFNNCFALYDSSQATAPWVYYSPGRKGMKGGYGPLTVYTLFKPIDVPALDPESIKTANATRLTPSTINLAGQRVKDAEGIVIENGKKVIR